ncbi:hypothetical protein SK128_021452, partial [Halocaridina rubra]
GKKYQVGDKNISLVPLVPDKGSPLLRATLNVWTKESCGPKQETKIGLTNHWWMMLPLRKSNQMTICERWILRLTDFDRPGGKKYQVGDKNISLVPLVPDKGSPLLRATLNVWTKESCGPKQETKIGLTNHWWMMLPLRKSNQMTICERWILRLTDFDRPGGKKYQVGDKNISLVPLVPDKGSPLLRATLNVWTKESCGPKQETKIGLTNHWWMMLPLRKSNQMTICERWILRLTDFDRPGGKKYQVGDKNISLVPLVPDKGSPLLRATLNVWTKESCGPKQETKIGLTNHWWMMLPLRKSNQMTICERWILRLTDFDRPGVG